MLICSKCGQTSPDGTRYCPNCGASLGTQKKAGCLSGLVVVVIIFVAVGMMISMCSPKKTEPEPVQTTKATRTSSKANDQNSEGKTSNARPQKDGFDVDTNKTVVIGSYQIKVPAYYLKGSYSKDKKTYNAEAESGEQSVQLSIEFTPGACTYDSLNANKEAVFNSLKNVMGGLGVENSDVLFSDYNSKLGKGIMAEYLATITTTGARCYIRRVFLPVSGGCLEFNLLQSNQSKWVYTNDLDKIVNSVEIKNPSATKKPDTKKKTTKKSTSKKSSKKTTKKSK